MQCISDIRLPLALISFAHKMIFANRRRRKSRLIAAVDQVPGHKIVKCKTDNNGEFSISILNIDELQVKDAKEIKFKVTV